VTDRLRDVSRCLHLPTTRPPPIHSPIARACLLPRPTLPQRAEALPPPHGGGPQLAQAHQVLGVHTRRVEDARARKGGEVLRARGAEAVAQHALDGVVAGADDLLQRVPVRDEEGAIGGLQAPPALEPVGRLERGHRHVPDVRRHLVEARVVRRVVEYVPDLLVRPPPLLVLGAPVGGQRHLARRAERRLGHHRGAGLLLRGGRGGGFGGSGARPMGPPVSMPPSGSAPLNPRTQPLTTQALVNATDEQRTNMIGERLFPLVAQHHPEYASKITGMLLEMEISDLLHLLESPTHLNEKIAEARDVLLAHQAEAARGGSVRA